MSDDWRVHAKLIEPADAGPMVKALHEHEVAVERELASRLGPKLPVSHDGNDIFIYATTDDEATAAAEAISEAANAAGIETTVDIKRWHPEAEEWRPADEPLPADADSLAAERAERERSEAAESAERGPQWEVRIDLRHRRDAVALEQRLAGEGIRSLRRFSHLFIYCATEDDAVALAERIKPEVPEGATVTPEGTPWSGAWQTTHPFAVLGGLGDS
jgi:hypothetical protein